VHTRGITRTFNGVDICTQIVQNVNR